MSLTLRWQLRWQLWRYKWFPYRTVSYHGLNDDGTLKPGRRTWHLPEIISDRLLP